MDTPTAGRHLFEEKCADLSRFEQILKRMGIPSRRYTFFDKACPKKKKRRIARASEEEAKNSGLRNAERPGEILRKHERRAPARPRARGSLGIYGRGRFPGPGPADLCSEAKKAAPEVSGPTGITFPGYRTSGFVFAKFP